MKTILIVANVDTGLYKFRKELLQALIERGDTVALAAPDGPFMEELRALGCRHIPLPIRRRGTNPLSDFRYYLNCKRIIREVKPDVALTYTIKPNIYGGMAAKSAGIPYIATITGLGSGFRGVLKGLVIAMYRTALKNCAHVMFQNEANKALFLELGIVGEARCSLASGSGVNLEQYAYFALPDGAPRFIFIGRIMREKGIEEYLTAAAMLKSECPEVDFDIVGWLEEDYEAVLHKFESDGIVKYHGVKSDIAPSIRAAHCVVLPSYHEGMSNVLLEGAAMGRALIASDIPGCREAIEDGVNGFLCKRGDVQSLHESMKRFIALTNDERTAMGAASHERAERLFDRRIVTQAMLDAISRACKSGQIES